jgi:intracellular sulfur oxidation DsrE/DsrF family protein
MYHLLYRTGTREGQLDPARTIVVLTGEVWRYAEGDYFTTTISKLVEAGVRFEVGASEARNAKPITYPNGVTVVPEAILRIAELQRAGWAYVRL